MSPAKQLYVLGQDEFDRLLTWLDPDPERAGSIYEKIRWRLIAILAARGCRVAEELADETIDRVARRVPDIEASYVGDKAIYFLAVLNNVHHEYLKRPVISRPMQIVADDTDDKERTHICLEKCLENLSTSSRTLIESYYSAEKHARIDLRKRLAQQYGIDVSLLRLRALRIRRKLQTCIEQCLEA
jgi:hypothetical protein